MCFGEEVPVHPTHLGFVDPNCLVEDIVKGKQKSSGEFQNREFILDAFENAQFLCEGYYLAAPSLELRKINGKQFILEFPLSFRCFSAVNQDEPIAIAYVPSHLYHIMFELFKVR